MKKIVAVILAGAIAMALSGCAGPKEESTPAQSPEATQSSNEAKQEISRGQFSIVGTEETPLSQGFYEVTFTLRNNTDETLNLTGFDVLELDADGNILDSYKSYNKNSVEIPVEPGQQATIPLTFSDDDNIAGFKSTKYYTKTESGREEGDFAEPFTAMR